MVGFATLSTTMSGQIQGSNYPICGQFLTRSIIWQHQPFSKERVQSLFKNDWTSFWRFMSLRSKSATDISIFYPSSVFLDARPANMTEYTMAKAAGEVLCADMQSLERLGPILVRWLPRLSTDQIATLFELEPTDSIEVILPIIREVHTSSSAHIQGADSRFTLI